MRIETLKYQSTLIPPGLENHGAKQLHTNTVEAYDGLGTHTEDKPRNSDMTQTHSPAHFISDRYRIREPLGVGGMGTVYRAYDRLTGEVIALKSVRQEELPGSSSGGLDVRAALVREFQVMASLRHPNIINTLDYGFAPDGQPFYTMELLDQASDVLQAYASDHDKIGALVDLLLALVYLHRHGIIHRDLKPANVLVSGGRLRVLDFGIAARAGGDDVRAGTLPYMAPEVLRNSPASVQSDLYAVGVIAFQLFTGRHPFDAPSSVAMMYKVHHGQPDLALLPEYGTNEPKTAAYSPVDVQDTTTQALISMEESGSGAPPIVDDPTAKVLKDETLRSVIGRLLSRNPADRYPDARAAIRALCRAGQYPLPLETELLRESFLQGSRFVGRDAELAELRGAVKSLSTHKGSCWLIGGESGVGKSRLIAEARILASAQGALLMISRAESDGGAAYAVWRDLIRRAILAAGPDDLNAGVLKALAPDIAHLLERPIPDPPPLEDRDAQLRLFAAALELLWRAAQVQPIVLLLEDLQWADAGSLELLQRLTASIDRHPILILASYRTDEAPDLPERIPGSRSITLPRLTSADIAQLAAFMIGEGGQQPELLTLVERETEGNAFFLVEVIRALAEDAGALDEIGRLSLPERVLTGGMGQVIMRRLDRVPADARPALDFAAVLGRVIDPALIAAVFPRLNIDRWLRLCVEAFVLDIADGRWQFVHDKLREGAIARIPDLIDAHRRAAETIEAVYAAQLDERAARLTYHYGEAGIHEKERHYARAAGEYAAAQYANADALKYLRRALELTPESDVQTRFIISKTLIDVLDFQGMRADHLALLQTLDTFADQLDPAQQGIIAAWWAKYYFLTGEYESAIAAGEKAIPLSAAAGDGSTEIETRVTVSMALFYLRRFAEARQHHEAALETMRRDKRFDKESAILNAMGSSAFEQDDFAEAVRFHGEALTAAERAENLKDQNDALNGLAIASYRHNLLKEGEQYILRALEVTRKTGNRRSLARNLNNLSNIYADQYDYKRNLECLLEAVTIEETVSAVRGEVIARNNLGFTYQDLGRLHDARTQFERMMTLCQSSLAIQFGTLARCNLARVCYHLGDFDKVTELLSAFDLTALDQEYALRAVEVPSLLARVALARGEVQKAHDLFQIAAPQAARGDIPLLAPVITIALAYTREQLGIARDAEQNAAFEAAVTALMSDDDPRLFDLDFWAHLRAADLLRAPDPERARAVIQHAVDLIEQRSAKIPDADLRFEYHDHHAMHDDVFAALT